MKKKIMSRFFSLLLAVLTLLSLSVTAFAAESTVTFQNGKVIAFAPGSVYTDADLFDNFKGVMPGDVLTEKISIENQSTDCDYIKVYMRAILHDEDGNPISEKVLAELQTDTRRGADSELEYMYDFLSQLSMTVKSGSSLIYEDTADQLDGLAGSVYLGTIRKGETIDLDVELTVPTTLGNEYADRIGEVDWVFTVEGFTDTVHTVRKVWDDGNAADRPDSITVHLMRNGAYYDKATLNAENQWTYTWSRLDNDDTWSVVEPDVPSGYDVRYNTDIANATVITNHKDVPVVPSEPVDLTVIKKWDDTEKSSRPASVKVTLYNGSTAVETVTLSDSNNWTYTWRDLDGNGAWQVQESNIPAGYTPSYAVSDGVVTITNTASLIQTGQLDWPIPVLGGLGILLLALGCVMTLRKRKSGNA